MPNWIKVIIVITEFCDVNQTLDINLVKLDEQAKTCDCRNGACELITNMVLHVFTLEPIRYAIARCICPALCRGTNRTQRIKIAMFIGIDRYLGQRLLLRVGLQGLTLLIANQVTNRSMHQQIRVSPYG